MISRRKLEALRALADRPGTPAEGEVAREMLRRHAGKAVREEPQRRKTEGCQCGSYPWRSAFCHNAAHHAGIEAEKKRRFPRGTRVFYNYWAYDLNCSGSVVGPGRAWNWIRIKFDHLKTVRSVPIWSGLGWHLSTEPLEDNDYTDELRHGMKRRWGNPAPAGGGKG